MLFLFGASLFSDTDKINAFTFGIINSPVFKIIAFSCTGSFSQQLFQPDILIKRIVFGSNYFFTNSIIKRQIDSPFRR